MILGVISDTHADRANALPHIMRAFKIAKVEMIIHCGDIDQQHLKPNLFLGLPVICALTEEQSADPAFDNPPLGWAFTKPGDRIRIKNKLKVYVGHKRSFDFLTGSEQQLEATLNNIRKDNDRISWLFSGHTHHQIFCQGRLINFVNPGAVENSLDGYEYVILNTKSGRAFFGRIPRVKPAKAQLQVGVISDSFNVSDLAPNFWKNLALALKDYGVNTLIHCGNISLADIGRPELAGFDVYVNIRSDQDYKATMPDNWHRISLECPVVDIQGYKFYVQTDLGVALSQKSEIDMYTLSMELKRKFPEITFVLFGFTQAAFLEEGELVRLINPGDVVRDQNFAVIGLPTTEVTFDHILIEPLPPVENTGAK